MDIILHLTCCSDPPAAVVPPAAIMDQNPQNPQNGQNGGQNGAQNPPLHLNIAKERNNPHLMNDRAYPTTPSTFPQPVFQGPSGARDQYAGFQQQNPNGYFAGNQYQGQQAYNSNMPISYVQAQASYQQRQGPYSPNNDGTNNLVDQFSHQNLGRPAPGYGNKQAVPSQRPRTAGATGHGAHSNYTAVPMPGGIPAPSSSQHLGSDSDLPPREGDKYSAKAHQTKAMAAEHVSSFFKNSVQRARDRNQRQEDLEAILADPTVPQVRKEQQILGASKAEVRFLRFLRTKETASNFETLSIIGKGAFGEVKLVRRKTDGTVYALKSLVKAEMFKRDQLAHVRSERDILSESDSPWVVKLYATFQDNIFLYMLMEFLPGGDLMTMLIKYEVFTEDITRFYMAQITLAIEAVHALGFIHRDIKPDNIILDRDGHIKLTDFGLSTGFHKLHDNNYYQQLLAGKSSKARDRNSVSLDQINLTVSNRGQINTWRKSRRIMAYSTVGTPDYIAPEIFGGSGYSFDCDWWSLGTIMFECLIGWPPFCAEDPHDTYRKIVAWRETLYFPEDTHLGPEAEHLLRSLICNTENRLGRGGSHELKNHPFFRGVNWDQLRLIRAPFEPKLAHETDTTYFPLDEIEQTDTASLLRAQGITGHVDENTAEMNLPFVGYTYKRFEAYRSK
ncbi:MAG: Serine/threonine-protein kinase [Trizodia sp. TS-e1964]|nr:MAG: Serine/threonine-protein kinase [Trizodia sp. TS-e1964]